MSNEGAWVDVRTWTLLVLALLPTGAVLLGALWIWQDRGEEISDYEHALTSVEATHEFHAISSAMLRSDASLRGAALPDATEEAIDLAAQDLASIEIVIEEVGQRLGPLLERLSSERASETDSEIYSFLGSSLRVAEEQFAEQEAGEPVRAPISLLSGLARQSAAGLVLPFAEPGRIRTNYLHDIMAATIRYHDRFDRDRARILDHFVSGEPIDDQLVRSALRAAQWKDVTDSRVVLPDSDNTAWASSNVNAATPLLLDTTDPLTAILDPDLDITDPLVQAELLIKMQEIDAGLSDDIDMAYDMLGAESAMYLADLRQERLLTGLTSLMMGFVGVGLAWLTIAEVRQRRNIEVAHQGALEQLGEKADRDPTTGIWNRRRLESELLRMILEAPTCDETVVIAYLDLDHFKSINDVWGHSTGDHVLRTVTERLSGFVHNGVPFELCRFGGDEFVLYTQMPEQSLEWYEELGQAVIDAVDSRMHVNGRSHEVGVSVGIATSTEDSTMDSLLLEADSSLILAKRERGRAVVYNRNISRTGELVHALPAAMARGEIHAHVQPVIDLKTGSVHHVEALARWRRSGGELVSPGVFVPLVESYGLAEKLTHTMLASVRKLMNLPATPSDARVWVNVSPRELDVANFAERFVNQLNELRIPPSRIGIEITETAAVRDPARLAIELRRVRYVGVSVAIDDFGSGYSPLGYLRILPVDVVKIDRTLVTDIDTDVANQHIVLGIVGFVRELGMEIVAEGVERIEEQAWLTDHGVDRVQGFLFDKPMDPDQMDWMPRTFPSGSPAVSTPEPTRAGVLTGRDPRSDHEAILRTARIASRP